MNRTYRLIWNQTANAWVVAPETAKTARKGGKLKAAVVAVAAAASVVALNAYALPTGGQVSAGTGTISQCGNTLTVNQGTQNLSVNWNTFNVGSSETVNFVQPNSSAIALNRVLGSDPSAIYGKMNANGQVFLVNPNGILFAKGAQVNVGGLVASTQNITDADFLNRNFHFSGTAGSVVNQGTINGNYVALLGGQVSNQGTIAAKLGTVALAAGSDMTLDFAGDGLIGVTVNQGTINALAENKQLIQADGGTVLLTAKAADSLISSVVNNTGEIDATSIQNVGGTIQLVGDTTAGIVQNSGTLNGNEVDASARSVLQSGTVNANTANLSASYALIQTDGASVNGSSVRVDGGANTFISGALTGTHDLTVAGQSIQLAGAQLATGNNGSIRVGGGEHGQDTDIANAQTVSVNGATTIAGGDGAQVAVWSDGTTNYFGNTTTGKNSFVEVSSKGTLNLGGSVTVGAGSQILYDPANIVIDASPTSSMFYLNLANPSSATSNQFGNNYNELANGNILVGSTQDNFGGTAAGAVDLYNGKTGALISTVTGSHAGDQLGYNGLYALSNGNYVIDSSTWNGGVGAVTWGSGTSGVSGVVSSANSLVGSTAGDTVGSRNGSNGITVLSNGNYVVDSTNWNGKMGAVTWGNGTTGVTGVISSANSLVGSTANDQVGLTGVTQLSNGNYVVDSNFWNGKFGAVTWGSGTSGVSGVVSSANSLVGSHVNDQIGRRGITVLSNGNYVVASSLWNGGMGAVTWGSGTSGVSGVVSSTNSLVGSNAGDVVGSTIKMLTNGNYVVASTGWNGGRGEATWGSGTSGVTGVVSSTNSLVGSNANDYVGGEIIALTNGNYLVASSSWNGNRGAMTWGSGTSGVTGAVSSTNSLVGSNANDYVGDYDVTILPSGNYLVLSPNWSNQTGAVTWGSGTSGVTGVVSSANSLVGSAPSDGVGANGIVTVLTNGNYVVSSPNWSNGLGAVTWGSGTSGVSGLVSSANSLVGSSSGDQIGSAGLVLALSNGNYVVGSPNWNNQTGAATWGNGTTGTTGVVTSADSLVGSTPGDGVGSQLNALPNGNYVVGSPNWNNQTGAATWGNGTTGTIGVVTSANSLVGSNPGDEVASSGVQALANGNYVVMSPDWNGGMGAATWGSGTSGVSGVISSANSLVGSTANDYVGGNGVMALPDGNYVVVSPNWNGNTGAVTWGSGTSGVSGVVSSANSLVGSTAGDQIGISFNLLSNGDYVVTSSTWNGNRGEVTLGSGASGVSGVVSSANSLVGVNAGDEVGLYGIMELTKGGNTGFLVSAPAYNNGQGAVWLVADGASLGTLASGSASDVTVSPTQLALADGAGSTVTLKATNNITVNSAVSVAGNLDLVAGNTVTLNAALTSTSSGDALVMAGTNFVNNAGANALSTPNGRWLVYADNPTANSAGGLSAGGANVFGATFSANAPSTIASGNHFVYVSAAPGSGTSSTTGTGSSTSTGSSTGTGSSTSTPPVATTASNRGPSLGYTGTLTAMQTLATGGLPTQNGLTGGNSVTGDTLNGSGNDGKVVTTLAVNTAGDVPVIPVPGLNVIDQGIRLPDGLGSDH